MFPREEPQHFPIPMEAVSTGSLPEDYQPRECDVCCGRGKKNWTHEGNKTFRKLIRKNVKAYQDAVDKQRRNLVVESIVETIYREGGRFLKQDDSKRWCDIGELQAREKVGHSLRDQVNAQAKAQQRQQEAEFSPRKRDSMSLLSSFSPKKVKASPVRSPASATSSSLSEHLHNSSSSFLSHIPSPPMMEHPHLRDSPSFQSHNTEPLDYNWAPPASSPVHSNMPLDRPSYMSQQFSNTGIYSSLQQQQQQYQQHQHRQHHQLPRSSDRMYIPNTPINEGPRALEMPEALASFENWSLNADRTPEQGRVQYPNFSQPLDAPIEPTPFPEHKSAADFKKEAEDQKKL